MTPICLLIRLPEEYNVILDMNNQETPPSFGKDENGDPSYSKAEHYIAEADKMMIEAKVKKTGFFVTMKFDPSTGEPTSTVMGISDSIRIE